MEKSPSVDVNLLLLSFFIPIFMRLLCVTFDLLLKAAEFEGKTGHTFRFNVEKPPEYKVRLHCWVYFLIGSCLNSFGVGVVLMRSALITGLILSAADLWVIFHPGSKITEATPCFFFVIIGGIFVTVLNSHPTHKSECVERKTGKKS